MYQNAQDRSKVLKTGIRSIAPNSCFLFRFELDFTMIWGMLYKLLL